VLAGVTGLAAGCLAAGKWIGNAEYSLTLSRFCPSDNAANMNGILFHRSLAGGRAPCR
jgi:hypothetical protein